MAVHTELTPAEAAEQKALFTDDTRFAVSMEGEGSEPKTKSKKSSMNVALWSSVVVSGRLPTADTAFTRPHACMKA